MLWETLDTRSVVLTSERRVGKTSVIRKMAGEPGNRVCFLRDVEDLKSPGEFVERMYEDVEPVLSRTERARIKMFSVLEKLGGMEIKDIKLPHMKQHWKNVLSALFEDIFAAEDRLVVFFWDELPLFLYSVKSVGGEKDAMEVLDVLRAMRQKYPNLRMVFTGSVGLHQVIGSLRNHGYANDPTNDMATIEVPPLEPPEGTRLADLLLEGEKVKVSGERSEIASMVSRAVGHIPYYIHYLVSRISNSAGEVSQESVEDWLESLITDPNDPAHFHYYQTRLLTYYGADSALAFHALDALALAETPMSFSELLNLVQHKTPHAGVERFREITQVLLKDHYIRKATDGKYSFRYSIVRRWWAYARG